MCVTVKQLWKKKFSKSICLMRFKEINQINSCSMYKSIMHLHQIWTTSEAGCSKKYCHSSSPCFDTELSLIAKWILILPNVRSKWSLALSLISSHILKEKNDSIGICFACNFYPKLTYRMCNHLEENWQISKFWWILSDNIQ